MENDMKNLLITGVLLLVTASCGRGPAGKNGIDGTDGLNGQDGTQIGIVKLCPGTTVYPSTFVEVAFCFGGTLYGTYSANNGFSTELPPGTYGSQGINSTCNFVIGANCAVSW